MKGSTGGSMQARSAKAAGVTTYKTRAYRRHLRKMKLQREPLDALAHRPVDLTPRLVKPK